MKIEYLDLLKLLKDRFEENLHRHENIQWKEVEKALISRKDLLATIEKMEKTGGEPDLVVSPKFKNPVYVDMVKESPEARRSLCYDKETRINRKKNPPKNSVEEMAEEIGVTLLNEEEYFAIQEIEPLDEKTSSWLFAPDEIRKLKGGIFGDRRYGRVFIYHNGPDSYYSSRGFRAYVDFEI